MKALLTSGIYCIRGSIIIYLILCLLQLLFCLLLSVGSENWLISIDFNGNFYRALIAGSSAFVLLVINVFLLAKLLKKGKTVENKKRKKK